MINEEQIEAIQQDANATRVSFVDTLPAEEQSKFAAVEKATQILVDAGVFFYLFPYLKIPQNPKIEGAWQWNSVGALLKFNKNGTLTDESANLNRDFQSSLLATVFKFFEKRQDIFNEDYKQTVTNFLNFYVSALVWENKRIWPQREITPDQESEY